MESRITVYGRILRSRKAALRKVEKVLDDTWPAAKENRELGAMRPALLQEATELRGQVRYWTRMLREAKAYDAEHPEEREW